MKNRTRSIQWMLARRIGLVVLVAGALFGLTAYFVERDRIGDLVADRALVAANRFNGQAQTALDMPGGISAETMQAELDTFLAAGAVKHRFGQYVLATIYDDAGNLLAEFADPRHPDMDQVRARLDAANHRYSADEYGRVHFARVGGDPYAHVAVPLADSSGAIVAHIEGVFAVSPSGVAELERTIAESVGAVLLVILVTAGLIYPIILSLIGRLSRMTINLLDANLETLKVLGGAVAKRDSDTDAHNYRVTIYSVRLAEAVGLPSELIRALIKGAFLHDVGKIGIRDAVLLKPGKLDDDEYAVMKTHVEHGIDLAAGSSWLEDGAAVVGCHHEKYDGGGYPNGMSGEDIPEIARIFAIADVFDAVASRRPYKDPCTYEETMEILERGRGTHFDPRLLDAFDEIARALYDDFAGIDGDRPRLELESITRRYFHGSIGEMVASANDRLHADANGSRRPVPA